MFAHAHKGRRAWTGLLAAGSAAMRSPANPIGRRRRTTSGEPPVPTGDNFDTEHTHDDLLLAAMGAGDPAAAKAFVSRFQRAVFGVAFATVGDVGLAEDVAQQAFEHAWRQAEAYDPRRGSVRTWLAGIAHNLAVDTIRIRRPVLVTPPDLADLIKAITASPEQDVLAEATRAELAEALAALPTEQSRAVVLAAVHGFTAREIAELEQIPIGTAKSRIRIGLEKLHDALPRQVDDA
jgi:RNA polymerase sigma-70 factor (ECF subfamily)